MADARSRDFRPVPLPVKLQAHMVSKVRPFESNNVIAMLPGSDAKLKTEAVMYTAHYDHLGIRPDMPGDNIYNGADDNATRLRHPAGIAHAYGTGGAEAARAPFCLLPLPRKSRDCWGQNIWANILPFPRERSRWT